MGQGTPSPSPSFFPATHSQKGRKEKGKRISHCFGFNMAALLESQNKPGVQFLGARMSLFLFFFCFLSFSTSA